MHTSKKEEVPGHFTAEIEERIRLIGIRSYRGDAEIEQRIGLNGIREETELNLIIFNLILAIQKSCEYWWERQGQPVGVATLQVADQYS